MPKGYHHLTYDKRCQIYILLKRGISQKEIASNLKTSQSTISREINRNKGKRGYRYKQAQLKAANRRHIASARPRKMTKELIQFMEKMLCNQQWSPEQISGYLKTNNLMHISHERIYQYIWSNKKNGGSLYKHLRCIGKKYNKRRSNSAGRGLISNRVGIEKRPSIVDLKERIGDFEIDTIVGSRHKGAIVSIVDRKSKITRIALISNASANETKQATIKLLSPIKKHVHTITSDNGKEFAEHQQIARNLQAQFYFANPYSSWERGLNENTNRLIRQYFPKGSNFANINQKEISIVEALLNNRPRKTLNFKTPNEVFLQDTGFDLNYALQY